MKQSNFFKTAFSVVALICSIATAFAQNKTVNPFDVKGRGRTLTPVNVPNATLHQRRNTNKQFQQVIRPLTEKTQPASSIFFSKQTQNTVVLGKNASVFDAQNAAVAYLEEFKTELGVSNPADEFITTNVQHDYLEQTHIRMQQTHKGIPVYGSEIILHTRNNRIEMLNGRFYPTPQLNNITPTINAATTVERVINDLKVKNIYRPLNAQQKKLLGYTQPANELVIYHKAMHTNGEKLAWKITLRPNMMDYYVYFVDAHTGEIINKTNMTCDVDGSRTATGNDLNNVSRTINTYQIGSTYYMIDATKSMFSISQSSLPDNPVGAIQVYDAQNTYAENIAYVSSSNNTNWSNTAISAHYNAGVAYDYYKNTHNRNSINGQGGNILSFINVSDQNGQGLDNAFWSGNAMFYGNGKVALKPLAGSLDVAGHEMTHGVVQNTAGLVYEFQSGALNESLADIFGCMMDRNDWLIGEDVVKTQYFPSGALRNLQDPHNGGTQGSNGWQPKHMNEYLELSEDEDHGGVHGNSGIPNHAFYLFATAVTKEKAEKIYYRAMTTYLTSTSQFIDMRIAVVQAATDLHGASSAEVSAAKSAFDAVGVFGNDPSSNDAVDLPVNPGDDYILSYDLNTSDVNTLYSSSTTGTNYVAKSTTEFKRKPSVVDDGSLCVFIDSDSKMRRMSLIDAPNETIISNETIWNNVAVSKDGSKIAALTIGMDTSIYVYDFATSEWKTFKLYNPTFSGEEAKGVRYADMIEWDYTGEHIIYDAYNEIANSQGSNLSYWDVGIINVWDNEANDWGSGKVEKLFTQLPEGASIGNPTFSKNSPYIIAFDYFSPEGYSIMAKNIITGEIGTLATNSKLGTPNYSKLDDQIIYDATNGNNEDVIAVRSLTANKLNGTGSAMQLIPEAQWGVWYSQGTRALLSAANDVISFSFPALMPPVTASIIGTNITANVPASTDVTLLVASFSSSPYSKVRQNGITQTSGVNKNDFTSPLTYVVRAQDGTTKSYTITVNKQPFSSAKNLTAFSFQGLNPAPVGVISGTNVSVNVPVNTDVTNLVATFATSPQSQALVNSVVQTSGTTTNDFTNPLVYTIEAEDASTKDYTITVVKGGVGMEDISKRNIINVFPNPVVNLLYVETKDDYSYSIFDISGKIILNGTSKCNEPIPTSVLRNGIYFMRIESITGGVYSGKFIKQE